MGGEGTMAKWASEGLANKDYIHFSLKGAAKMGNILADALECQYRFYRIRKAIKQ
jgi:lysophospholipase L1-like esterase